MIPQSGERHLEDDESVAHCCGLVGADRECERTSPARNELSCRFRGTEDEEISDLSVVI